MFHKLVQMLAYTDDINIIVRSQKTMDEAFLALEQESRDMGLNINQLKTKYMVAGKA